MSMPSPTRLLDQAQDLRHGAPVLGVGHLEVGDVYRDLGLAGNPEYLGERLANGVALAALMRLVHAAVLRGDLGHLDQLLGPIEAVRGVHESRVDSERPVLHRLPDDLGASGRARRASPGGRPWPITSSRTVDVPRWVGEVDVRGVLLEPAEVVVERPPVRCDAEALVTAMPGLDVGLVRRRDRVALALDLQRHALGDLAPRARVDE